MHTEQEKEAATIAAMTKDGWPPEYDQHGNVLWLSEGSLAKACFNAGYALRAALPTVPAAAGVATDAMVTAALASTTPGEGPYTLEQTLDFSGADTARRVVKAALQAALNASTPPTPC